LRKENYLNRRSWEFPVDDDDASFNAIGRDAIVMSIAVFAYQRAVITSVAQREIVFHLEIIQIYEEVHRCGKRAGTRVASR